MPPRGTPGSSRKKPDAERCFYLLSPKTYADIGARLPRATVQEQKAGADETPAFMRGRPWNRHPLSKCLMLWAYKRAVSGSVRQPNCHLWYPTNAKPGVPFCAPIANVLSPPDAEACPGTPGAPPRNASIEWNLIEGPLCQM